MTCKELIEELAKFDPNAEVYTAGDCFRLPRAFPFSIESVAPLNVTRKGFGTEKRPTKSRIVFLHPGVSLQEQIKTGEVS